MQIPLPPWLGMDMANLKETDGPLVYQNLKRDHQKQVCQIFHGKTLLHLVQNELA
jgi:hypothetical protein